MTHAVPTGIAAVGCGYIADFYRYTLDYHRASLSYCGVWDTDRAHLDDFARQWGERAYGSLDELLAEPAVRIVLNLTEPQAHFEVSRAILAAGKHLYSEKPLAMTGAEARQLRDLGAASGLQVAAAPCNLLGEMAQTLWRAVRDGCIGTPRLVYAEIDDGMIHKATYRDWKNHSGRDWPARSEFETGCTFEHTGYVVGILAAMFGPVERVTAVSHLCIADKQTIPPLPQPAPDFSVGCLEFANGVVARLTNSIVAPYDHRLRIIGDDGVLEVTEPWDYASPVRLRKVSTSRLARFLERRFGGLPAKRIAPVRKVLWKGGRNRIPSMDFLRGVEELAAAINEGRPSRLSADLAVHITEVTEMLQYPDRFDRPAAVASRFAPIEPMDWAK